MNYSFSVIFFIFFSLAIKGHAQEIELGLIKGKIEIDSTWGSNIYLSYIPTFEEMYAMSSEMIISKSKINEDGRFSFPLDYLPEAQKLYRLHITKKGDSRSSLIIGGKNENFLFLVANKHSRIDLKVIPGYSPFKNVAFKSDQINYRFHQITNLINASDSIASESDLYKRKFIDEKLKKELLTIADSSSNALIAMYAIYKSGFESDFKKNAAFYEGLAEKWTDKDNAYFQNFKAQLPQVKSNANVYLIMIIAIFSLVLGIVIGHYIHLKNSRIATLSVQERKILQELEKGMSNKEISEKFNIGVSTVKSHVSSILSKMNAKSRKDLMHTK